MTKTTKILSYEEAATIAKRLNRVMGEARAKTKRLTRRRVETINAVWYEWWIAGQRAMAFRGSEGTFLSDEAVASLTW